MGLYSVTTGSSGAPRIMGAPIIVTTFHPAGDGPDLNLDFPCPIYRSYRKSPYRDINCIVYSCKSLNI